ncbi:MAG: ORF6N domain-containing protein [Verrucomicrobiota bacterium]|jgi:hypothetical protein
MRKRKAISSAEPVVSLIRFVRSQCVILDADLAKVYGVTTTRLNQQVQRNAERFPNDFAFRLTVGEFAGLMLQIATSKNGKVRSRLDSGAQAQTNPVKACSRRLLQV